MSLTYDVLLDHIANLLIYLFGAPSFGFCSIQAMTMAATSPVDSKVAVTVARLVGKREKELIPSRKPRGDTTKTMTMKACHYNKNNQLTMIGVGKYCKGR
jgi:hypothetical protein